MNIIRRLGAGILGFLVSASLIASVPEVDPNDLVPDRREQQATVIINKVIDKYHYKKQALDNQWSERILDRYLESLDPNRSFFLESDIDTFMVFQHGFDESIRSAALTPAFDIFRIYRKRVDERVAYALKLLDGDFDFTKEESYRFDRKDAPWAGSPEELDDLWRKRVKNDVLALRMAGKDEGGIKETLRSRYQGIRRRVAQFTADDVFQTFINAYTLTLEPHTSYMSPAVSENFDISMRLSLEGIGAVLGVDDEYTEVKSVVPGGPAKLSGQLQAGDRIVGVAQGHEPMVDVVGWRLRDVVQLIRGPKGSVVRLQILPKDAGLSGKRKEISLVRDKIKLEDQAAKKQIIEDIDGLGKYKIGVIEIPTFYRDFRAEVRGEDNFRSTTRDVRKLLDELEAAGVDGIVVDLRDNGGGSLSEATELTGLFIETGPVVQVRDSSGEIEVENDSDPSVAYGGPMAVLVNRNSASASEIFASAIQDYGRGIIIGEPTFGKGTVQTLVDLDRFVRDKDANLGRLRLTMAQFFRINGGSTQHRGVVPDILFPTASGAEDHGERSLDYALPWASIKPAKFTVLGAGVTPLLQDRHQKRIAKDPGFQMLLAEESLLREIQDTKEVTLVESRRRAEQKEREEASRSTRNRFRVARGLRPLTADDDKEEDKEEDDAEADAVNRIQLDEAARVLVDYIEMQRPLAAMR